MTQDDQAPYQKSLELFQNPEIFIANTVILETENKHQKTQLLRLGSNNRVS